MDTKKIIARVEKMKVETAALLKEAAAEKKRAAKIVRQVERKRAKLSGQRDRLTTSAATAGLTEEQVTKIKAKTAKLQEQIDKLTGRIADFADSDIGHPSDWIDETVVGALKGIAAALDDLVSGKGKKAAGMLISYENAVAELTSE